jgi:hypothetical protein
MYRKYLKYKKKYLEKKNQKGGLRRCNLAIDDVKLENMIVKPSTAMVHVHGCIIGKRFVEDILSTSNETFIKSTFTLPHNVNIITCSVLNKSVEHEVKFEFSRSSVCSSTSVGEITDFIKTGKKFFENNNMGNMLTSDCIEFFKKYIEKHAKGHNPDITNPNGYLHLRNHIYPSDINESFLGHFEDFHGIEIISNDRIHRIDKNRFRQYISMSGNRRDFSNRLLLSELLCYLFGVKTLSETLNLPHLTIILHSCRSYCDEHLVRSSLNPSSPNPDVDPSSQKHIADPSDEVYSRAADSDSASFSENNNYELNDIVLISGTDNININSLVGEIINITPLDTVIIKHPHRPELNGKTGTIKGFDKIKKIYKVLLTDSRFNIPENFNENYLIFQKGYEIKFLQNDVFNIQPKQIIKLKNLGDPFDDQQASVFSVGNNSLIVRSDTSALKVDSSNIDMLPINIDSSNNFRKLKKVDFERNPYNPDKNYLYVVDGPNNFKIASSCKLIEFNLYNPNHITIKDNYSQILKNITLNDIYEVL